MWYEGNYRRIFLDMHISDDRPEYLSKLDPEKLVSMLYDAGAQMIVVKCRPHTGLAYYPTRIGRMHKGLNGRDYVGEMIHLCHQRNIAVKAYFSQIFDNDAYERHPQWRMIDGRGKTSREETFYGNMFRSGRYGILCPNNEEYRQYVHDCLTEITANYQFETIFLDMPFWPVTCYCPTCRKKYFDATGTDLPRIVQFGDPAFRGFQRLREDWMGEFVALSTNCVKSIRPEVTIEHNCAVLSGAWRMGTTELVSDASDYVGGDLYGGILEQSFICKYYRNITKALPFAYITSRCDPNLQYHTTTKSAEEFLQHAILALAHDGALSICDGANPDGTLCEEVYTGPVREAFANSCRFEKYVGGDLLTDVSIWFPTRSKYDMSEDGLPICPEDPYYQAPEGFLMDKLAVAKNCRAAHIPFDVVPSRKLSALPNNVLVVSNVVNILDNEMDQIERFLQNGGNVYVSGTLGHPRLYELLAIELLGMTQQDVTYMTPTEKGQSFLQHFSKQSPLAVQRRQELVKSIGDGEVLATVTLPYTETGLREFAAIHSNPPGVPLENPAVLLKKVGKGKLLWAAASIESAKPYMSRMAFIRLLKSLCGKSKFKCDAPSSVEVIGWKKNEKLYFAIVNEQEEAPFVPATDITLVLPYEIKQARLLESDQDFSYVVENGKTVIHVARTIVFHMIEIDLESPQIA